jgi:SET domain-containing protein
MRSAKQVTVQDRVASSASDGVQAAAHSTSDHERFAITNESRRVVEIRPSTLAGAGQGVFALQTLRKNHILFAYRGERLTRSELQARYRNREDECRYVLQLSNNVFVDAIDPSTGNESRYINHQPSSKRTCNCMFTLRGNVKTLRTIQTGEELFANYGALYTHALRAVMLHSDDSTAAQ